MAKNEEFDQGYGKLWTDVCVSHREGYRTSVNDYHEHDFYEINLILSGNVRILLGDRSEEGTGKRLVLTRPGTPHYISCQPDVLYSRRYLMFSEDFVAGQITEWQTLSAVFGNGGAILSLSEEETARIGRIFEEIGREGDPLRRRLLIYYFLSLVSDRADARGETGKQIPRYVVEVLTYIDRHYGEHIVAEALARRLHVGRTTLLTAFKECTGKTLGEYLTLCRLQHAEGYLRAGKTIEYTAARCGFSDASGLVRSFKRCYGTTPRRYVERGK